MKPYDWKAHRVGAPTWQRRARRAQPYAVVAGIVAAVALSDSLVEWVVGEPRPVLVAGFLVAVVVAAVGWERATTARVETARYERANEQSHRIVKDAAACEGCPLSEREAS